MSPVSYCFIKHLVIFILTWKLHRTVALLGPHVRRISPSELPFVASLSRVRDTHTPAENHFCTGILISDRTILTAQHCTVSLVNDKVVIRIGSPDLRFCDDYEWDTWRTYAIWAIQNRKPSDRRNDDVAIIKLKERVNIRPAILKTTANAIKYGSKLYMAGWGDLDDGSGPDYMRKVSVKVLPIEECKERTVTCLPVGFFNWERKICTATDAESGYAIVGLGDSGGPLYDSHYHVVGINIGHCPAKQPLEEQVNDHCTIRYYIDFIRDFM